MEPKIMNQARKKSNFNETSLAADGLGALKFQQLKRWMVHQFSHSLLNSICPGTWYDELA